MKKKYQVTITDGTNTNTFNLLGKSKQAVKELCDIVHPGTGWKVNDVQFAMRKKVNTATRQLCLF